MASKKLRLIAAGAVVLGISVSAVPSVNASEPTGLRTNSNHSFVSYQDAVPGVAPVGADATAVYLDESGREIPVTGMAPEAALACTPVSGRDRPHKSSGDVSGHGWWKKGNCSNNRADVYNCLYEYYTDGSWRRKACSPTKRLKPYTGSGQRTVARKDCANSRVTSWRNHVDVDVVDEGDTAEWPYRQNDVVGRVY